MINKRIQSLEGLRGFAAFAVLIGHIFGFFLWGTDILFKRLVENYTQSSVLSNIAYSILRFFKDGELAVYIFWVMSGYVVSIGFFKKNNKEYRISAFSKRYFRLVIPVLGSVLIAYLLMHFDLMFNIDYTNNYLGKGASTWLLNFYNFDVDFVGAVKSAVWDVFFLSGSNYNIPLWSLKAELWGILFIIFINNLFHEHKYRFFLYFTFIFISISINEFWISSFIVGLVLCEIDYTEYKLLNVKRQIESILSKKYISISLMFFLIIISGLRVMFGLHCLFLATLIVFFVINSVFISKLFSNRLMVFLGENSFSIYLLHWPLLSSISCYVFLLIELSHFAQVLITSFISVIIVLFVSVIYTKYVDNVAIVLSKKVGDLFLITNKEIKN